MDNNNQIVTCPHCESTFPVAAGNPRPVNPAQLVRDAIKLHAQNGKVPIAKVREHLANNGIADKAGQDAAIEAARQQRLQPSQAKQEAPKAETPTKQEVPTPQALTPPQAPTPAKQSPGPALAPAQHVHEAVKKAGGQFNLAPLHKIREHLAAAGLKTRSEQDAAIDAARRAGLVTGSAIEGRHGVAKEELEASLPDPGSNGGRIGFLSDKTQHLAHGGTVGKEWGHHEAIHALVTGFNDDLADEGHNHRVHQNKDGQYQWHPEHPDTQYLAQGGQVQPGFFGRMMGKVGNTYQRLHKRYGGGWAKAIMGAGVLGLPIPLPMASVATAAPVMLAAELHRYLAGPNKPGGPGQQPQQGQPGQGQAEPGQDGMPDQSDKAYQPDQGGEPASPGSGIFQPEGTDTQPAVLPQGSEVIPVQQAQANQQALQQLGGQQVPDQPDKAYQPQGEGHPAELTPGEVVVPPDHAQQYRGELKAMEHGKVAHMATGGTVGGGGGTDTRNAPDALEGLAQAGDHLAKVLEALAGNLGKLKPGTSAQPANLAAGVPGGAGEAAKGLDLGAVAGGIGGAFTAITGAVQGAIAAFQQAISTMASFVEALNPGTVQQFNQAIRDLQATVGVTFQPVIEILTGTFRQIAGIILPIMEAIRPVAEQLARVFESTLIPMVQLLADTFEALMPIIELAAQLLELFYNLLKPIIFLLQILAAVLKLILAPIYFLVEAFKSMNKIMDGINEVLKVVAVIFKTVVQTIIQFIASLFGGGSTDIMDSFTAACKKVIEGLLVFTAYLAKAFGFDNFLKNLIQNLKPKVGATAAAQGVSIKSFEQITKDIAVASSTAAGAGTTKKEFDLSDVVKTLEEIEKGTAEGNKAAHDKLGRIADAVDAIAAVVGAPSKVYEFSKDVWNQQLFNKFGLQLN